jgi:adenosylcobinamide-phosphate synthase
VRTQAPAHPSPNAGVAEAAFAAALGLRLGGENRYGDRIELRPPLGTGRPAEAGDIARAVTLARDVSLALAGAFWTQMVVKSAVFAQITTICIHGARR